MKVVTILGARPQFIKAAPVSKALHQAGISEFILHTGQHYDEAMSQRFFDDLELPPADVNLGVGSGSHGWQTGQMLIGIEPVLQNIRPDWVIVYGDTNSTLAGALAAVKLNLPLAHVEAGLRSYNRSMPEEHNRVLTDHCADLLFCPTQTTVENLKREGLAKCAHWVGDVMYDAVLLFTGIAERHESIFNKMRLSQGKYFLATIHRPSNTDDSGRLKAILEALDRQEFPVVFPIHPRTRMRMIDYGWDDPIDSQKSSYKSLHFINPTGYLDMLILEKNARLILTDSGGVQKEAYWFGVPCLTIRFETEWIETVQAGWNRLVEANTAEIIQATREASQPSHFQPAYFGDGTAAAKISDLLLKSI